MSSNIDWDKSFFMDATMVAIAGLEGISINDHDPKARPKFMEESEEE
jgi:hypothetical protein